MFAVDSFWRDLVTFTWNLKTVEGRDGVADMLERTARRHRPDGIPHHRDPRRSRRRRLGVHRIRDRDGPRQGTPASATSGDEAVDAADHAAGAQGPRGAPGRDPRQGCRARLDADTRSWAEKNARSRRRSSATRAQPYVAGRRRRAGRHRARCAAASARRPADRRRPRTSAPATSGATATSRCACTTRSGTTTCPTCRSRRTGRCSRRRTRSATGSRCTPASWRFRTGRKTTVPVRDLRRGRRRSGPSSSTATART